MPPRRVYPSWLPPNPREREGLLKIRREQTFVLLWMAGLIPAGWLMMLLVKSDDILLPLMAAWIVAGVLMAHRAAASKCPRCGGNFCETRGMPYWYGLFTRRCENCGVSLKPPSND
jgi:hypothetical protein